MDYWILLPINYRNLYNIRYVSNAMAIYTPQEERVLVELLESEETYIGDKSFMGENLRSKLRTHGAWHTTDVSGDLGQSLRVRIPARDISIALSEPSQSSILNVLNCTIDDIEDTDASRVLVRLKLAQQTLLARLTRKSLDRLQLTKGQHVYAQIKTVALLSDNHQKRGDHQ